MCLSVLRPLELRDAAAIFSFASKLGVTRLMAGLLNTTTLLMRLRSILVAIAVTFVLARSAVAQASGADTPAGVWRGTSLCTVRPSPCNDENVVYRITRAKTGDSLSLDARKIVNGREEEMGVIACRVAATGVQFICTMPNGVWHFTVRSDSLVGELRLLDNTKYRDIRTARSR
jgi:hypothetical protein